MDWYYAIDDERRGPAPADEISRLSREGVISAETLLWKDGMAGWRPFREVASEIHAFATGDGDAPETAVCAYSGQVLPKSEMVPYGEVFIAAEHKDAFVQQLMETGKTAVERSTGELQYTGFWWRFLACVIDYFVLLIPSMLCMLPYFILSIGNTFTQPGAEPGTNPAAGWTVAMLAANLLGSVANLGVNGFYHTWMLGKYQATIGKIAIGAKVVKPDGSAITYGRAFGRWLARSMLNGLIMVAIIFAAAMVGGVLVGVTAAGTDRDPSAVIGGVIAMVAIVGVAGLLGLFPYWMAAFDAEKRALHDRICSTRVVKK